MPAVPASRDPAAHPTPARILDAAEALFAERGFAGTAVRDIAARCDLNAASLYNHFENKQALYEAVLERGLRPLLELLARSASGGSGPLPVDRILTDVMAHLSRTPHVPRLILLEAASGGSHLAGLAQRWMRPLVAQAVATAKREDRGDFDESEFPLLITAWMNLIFGPFALAPLLAELFDEDPLSPAALERQTLFLRRLAARLMASARAPAPARRPKGKKR